MYKRHRLISGPLEVPADQGACDSAPASSRIASTRKAMSLKPQLMLDVTGQFLSVPLVGAHDNSAPAIEAVERCLAQLGRISGH
jgi:hypothetical protein